MRVLIIGGDGYRWLGHRPASLRSRPSGRDLRQPDPARVIKQLGISTLTRIRSADDRLRAWKGATGEAIRRLSAATVTDYDALRLALIETRPDAVVHFGQQRSAPFSMISIARARGRDPDEQHGRQSEPVVGDARGLSGRTSGEARHDGWRWHAQHRGRRRLHHDRKHKGRSDSASVPQDAGVVLPSWPQGSATVIRSTSRVASGGCARPI